MLRDGDIDLLDFTRNGASAKQGRWGEAVYL